MRTSTTIRDQDYLPMIVVDPKVKALLICPVCGAAVCRTARTTHSVWHADLDGRAGEHSQASGHQPYSGSAERSSAED